MDRFYKTILDNLFDGVYFVDSERRITYWNKGAERISGFFEAEVLNLACYDNILNHVDETGKRLCLDGCPLAEVLKDGIPRQAEVFLRHKAGHRVPVAVRITPVYEGNTIVGAVEIFSDTCVNQARRIVHLPDEDSA